MVSWLVGIVVCLGLLAGCGGGPGGNLVKNEPAPPALTVPVQEDNEEAALTEELSAKRLEELYTKSGIPGWDPSLEQELKQWEHQVKFDVPIQMNKQVRAYLVYFSTERKEIIRRYLARSSRYLPLIKETFQEYGLPEDMAYLAMIESGFNNKAYSSAAACGMWQFIKGTGLRYGLAIDGYVDERRDPEKATKAAAKYLLDLYKQFGSWYLAAASYNCGENRVQRELDQSSHKNFWELSANMCLPSETKNYVPQMIAATIIAKNPEKFGFKNVPYLPPLKYDRVQVNEPTSLKAAAVAVNVPLEEVQALNPELTRGVTPPDSSNYVLNLPPNSKEVFGKNITIARIEQPAIASRPVRTAKATGRSYTNGKSHSVRKASVAAKPAAKTKMYANASKKPEKPAARAGKGKPTHTAQASNAPAKAGAAPVVQASLFGGPSPAAKAKGKAKAPAAKATGKSAETRLAKKSDSSNKNSGKTKTAKKNGSSEKKSKDKVSKHKSRALFAEAR